MPIYQIFPAIFKQVDTFTSTGSGTLVNTGNNPIKQFAIQVEQTGVVTGWTVRLQTSIDGINFTNILIHTLSTGAGQILYSTTASPALYFRANCSGLTLGLGTNITVTTIGSN